MRVGGSVGLAVGSVGVGGRVCGSQRLRTLLSSLSFELTVRLAAPRFAPKSHQPAGDSRN